MVSPAKINLISNLCDYQLILTEVKFAVGHWMSHETFIRVITNMQPCLSRSLTLCMKTNADVTDHN
jgi:hypothetical protein